MPGRSALGLAMAPPEIDDDAAVLHDADGGTDLVARAEVLAKGGFDRG